MAKRILESIALGNEDGSITVIEPGIYDDKDEVILRLTRDKRTQLFEDAFPAVEQATAAPGEKRGK
jgi:hypothetical protein